MQKDTDDTAIAAFMAILTMFVFIAILATSLLTFTVSSARAASERVRNACQHDYLAYCSQHPEEGAAVRKCMDAHGPQLSKACVDALVADGEVSRAEVERRKTASRR